MPENGFSKGQIAKVSSILGIVVLLIFGAFAKEGIIENVDATNMVMIQALGTGHLNQHTTPGWATQWFGKVTTYKKSDPYWFGGADENGNQLGNPIKIRFNDAGEAMFGGYIRWYMPSNPEQFEQLHILYGSQDAIERDLIAPIVKKAVYMAGPLMSSRESYSEKRPDLIRYIDDMVNNGVYQTTVRDEKAADPITGEMKTVQIVELIPDPNSPGGYKRQEESAATRLGIKFEDLSPAGINYSERVRKQIDTQMEATMAVQTSMAKALEAEQDAIRAQKQGEAEAIKAKWAQEVIKATAVTKAEQEAEVERIGAEKRRNVAELDKEAAAFTKAQLILLGEGESKRKKLNMEADGALNPKLEAWIEVNKHYANAIQGYQGNWVPGVVMGGGENGGANVAGGGAQQLIDMLSVKTARDLSLDMDITGNTKK